MSNIHPSLAPVSERIKALQYLFDVAGTAPAPRAVHDQVKVYAQFLSDSFTPLPEEEKPEVQPGPVTVAEAVAEARATDAATPGILGVNQV